MELFIEAHQYQRINAAENKAASAKDVADRMRYEVRDLHRKIDGLTLACQALWEILRAQTGMNSDLLLAKIQEIDLRDGKFNGKITGKVLQCHGCGRPTGSSRR